MKAVPFVEHIRCVQPTSENMYTVEQDVGFRVNADMLVIRVDGRTLRVPLEQVREDPPAVQARKWDGTIWGLYESTRDVPEYLKSREYFDKVQRRVWAEQHPGKPFPDDAKPT